MKWFIKCIKNYAVFKGRAARPEFWYFALASAIIQISLFIIDIIIGWDVGIIYGIKTRPLFETSRLLLLVPSISVTVRRLHDINKIRNELILTFFIMNSLCELVLIFGCTSLDREFLLCKSEENYM